MKTDEFDWYKLSKLNESDPHIETFASIIKKAHLNRNLDTIPGSYKKKLLITFQNCSSKLQGMHKRAVQDREEAEWQKKVISDQICQKKGELENSLNYLNALKMEVDKKKKTEEKMKKKLLQKKSPNTVKNEGKETYFCPFCHKNDFPSKETFLLHTNQQHQATANSDKQLPQYQKANAEIKEFLMSLKDKEYQLMEMILSKQKEMQTQELQKAYQFQLKKLESQPSFYERRETNRSATENLSRPEAYSYREDDNQQGEELKGESQFIFYQQNLVKEQEKTDRSINSQYYHRYAMPEIQKRNHESKTRDGYYNIFESELLGISENQSQYSAQSASFQQIQSKGHDSKQKNKHIHRNISWDENSYRKNQQIKSPVATKTFKPSLQQKKTVSRGHSSVYSSSKAVKIKTVHIFNAGPLQDDQSGNSDIQDYFDPAHSQRRADEIEDEEIRMDYEESSRHRIRERRKQTNEQFERINFSHSKSNVMLEYSKDRSSLDISKEKSSDYVDLSNSFSKKNVDCSKDDDTINLSDLKLSKLEKEKYAQNWIKSRQKCGSDDQYYNIELNKDQVPRQGFKKEEKNENILLEFQKPIESYENCPHSQIQQVHKQRDFVKFDDCQLNSKMDSNHSRQSQPSSILDEFIRK